MIGAGLLARNAVQRGLTVKPWVKTSLAPGSLIVTEYYKASGLLEYLAELGFNIVGYGCTTCIGNSGPLPEAVSKIVKDKNLVVASVLSGNRNFEGRIQSQVRANYLASPPLVVAYALAGRMQIDMTTEPLGHDRQRPAGLPERHLADRARDPGDDAELGQVRDVPRAVRARVRRRRALALAADPDRRALRVDRRLDLHPQPAVLRGPHARADAAVRHPLGARVLAVLGDSVTTDHISPAGSIPADSPAGKYLIGKGVSPADFNSYGARRGNHEVMMRGTFANIRLRNQLAPGTEGGWTTLLPQDEVMTIYDASVRYREAGVPLMIIAGKEYGSGSSRDWAAKGTLLLGVKAVLAESFERIHRSNLVNMGVLPLRFQDGETAASLKLTGREIYDILGVGDGLSPGAEVRVRVTTADGASREITAIARIDTPEEVVAFRNGGLLPYVLRQLAQS